MRKVYIRGIHIYISLVLVLLGLNSNASHLMGGSLTYEFSQKVVIGNDTYWEYNVTLKAYRDCTLKPDGSQASPFDDQITMGIYYDDGNKNLYQTQTSSNVTETTISPPWDSTCSDRPTYCVSEGIYTWTIDLPQSSVGFHLYWIRCCRNEQMNIESMMGQGYYAFVPPTSIKNNSPYFTQVPVPFICIGDTFDFPNSTADNDGDSLVYSFEWPLNSDGTGSPTPSMPSQLPDPLTIVDYKSGYGVSTPFGSNGYAYINAQTGLCKYYIPQKGNYSVAVEVKEYRNGTLIGIVRRDVQLIATDACNNISNLRLAPGVATSYTAVEGEQLCFNIIFKDTSLLKVDLTAWGDPIDGTGKVNGKTPYATITKSGGTGTATAKFCWTPATGLANAQPYFITVEAKDNGCPSKTSIVNIFIKVVPFDASGQIKGNISPCLNAVSTYSVPNKLNYQYDWTVMNGNIQSGQGTSSIDVSWSSVGPAAVILVQKNAGGVASKPDTLQVTVIAAPSSKPVSGNSPVCEYEKGVLYNITYTDGSTYQWFVQNGTRQQGVDTDYIYVDWGAQGEGRVVAIETNIFGCPGDSNVMPVTIIKPVTSPIDGSPSVCPNITGVLYSVGPTNGSLYYWFVNGGTQVSGGNTTDIRVDWGGSGNGMVKVVEVNDHGCIGDTVYFPVTINWKLAGEQPQGDTVVCAYTSGVNYKVHNTNYSSYAWQVSGGGTLVAGNGTESIIVDWNQPGQGYVIVVESSYDSIGMMPCFSDPDTLPVKIAELPSATMINGDFDFCAGQQRHLFSTAGNSGSTYIWKLDTTLIGSIADTISLVFPADGTYTLSFTEMTADSCIGIIHDSEIIVHPVPQTSAISGDSNICYPSYDGHSYQVTGLDESGYNWMITNGTLTSGQGSSSIMVNWNGKNPASVKVVETSIFGCQGDTMQRSVYIDHSAISLDYITVGHLNDQAIELYWHLENAPRYQGDIDIYKRVGQRVAYRFVQAVDSDITTYTDVKVDVNDTAYEYILKGKDLCGGELSSGSHTSILLKGMKFTDELAYDSKFDWTRYQGWPRGVLNYEILRRAGIDTFSSYEVKNDTTTYYTNGLETYTDCYRIAAHERSGPYTSYSNTVCINFDPVVWVPNAFTPNDDLLNDQFLLKGGAVKYFDIKIYNCWGEQMFNSNHLDLSWDGNFFGKPCEADIYVYVVKYWGADNVLQTITGDIHLMR